MRFLFWFTSIHESALTTGSRNERKKMNQMTES